MSEVNCMLYLDLRFRYLKIQKMEAKNLINPLNNDLKFLTTVLLLKRSNNIKFIEYFCKNYLLQKKFLNLCTTIKVSAALN